MNSRVYEDQDGLEITTKDRVIEFLKFDGGKTILDVVIHDKKLQNPVVVCLTSDEATQLKNWLNDQGF